jgi:hypothetical protein
VFTAQPRNLPCFSFVKGKDSSGLRYKTLSKKHYLDMSGMSPGLLRYGQEKSILEIASGETFYGCNLMKWLPDLISLSHTE